jgi:hypothetical protein
MGGALLSTPPLCGKAKLETGTAEGFKLNAPRAGSFASPPSFEAFDMSGNPSGGGWSVGSKQGGNLGRVEYGMRRECGAGCHSAAAVVSICWPMRWAGVGRLAARACLHRRA